MSTNALVEVERPLEGCALVTLNRPQAMNALSQALRREFVQTFHRLQADASIRVVVLTGAGKAFCAGMDLKEMAAASDSVGAVVLGADEDPVPAMEQFSGPIIGAINGPAITGGFELALACDVLITSSAARFADTHARVGVLPGWGISQRLPRLIGPQRAKELSFTGNFITAQQAEAWGLVNRVVAPDALMPQALALAQDMLSADAQTQRAYKRLIDDGLALNLRDGLALEKQRMREWAARLDTAAIEARRQQVRERGRKQSSD